MKNEHSVNQKRICDRCWQKKLDSGEEIDSSPAPAIRRKSLFEKASAVRLWGDRVVNIVDKEFKERFVQKTGAELIKGGSQSTLGDLLMQALCQKQSKMVDYLAKYPDDTMAFFGNHPNEVMKVISRSAKELVRVLRKYPNSALPLLKEKMKLADIVALQARLKDTAQHVFILQTVISQPSAALLLMRKHFNDSVPMLRKNPEGLKEMLMKHADEIIPVLEQHPDLTLAYVRDFSLPGFMTYLAAQPMATKALLRGNETRTIKYVERHAKDLTTVLLRNQPHATIAFLRAHPESTMAFLTANPWTSTDFFTTKANQITAILANHPAQTLHFLSKHPGATLSFLAKPGPRTTTVDLIFNKNRKAAMAFLYNNTANTFGFFKKHPEETIAAFKGDASMLEGRNRRTTMQLMLTHEDAMMAMLKKFPDGAVKLLQKSSKQAMALLSQLHGDTIEVLQRHPTDVLSLLKSDRKGSVALLVQHVDELMEVLALDPAATVAMLAAKPKSAVTIFTKHPSDTIGFLLSHLKDTTEFMATSPKDTMRMLLENPATTMTTLKKLEATDSEPSLEASGTEEVATVSSQESAAASAEAAPAVAEHSSIYDNDEIIDQYGDNSNAAASAEPAPAVAEHSSIYDNDDIIDEYGDNSSESAQNDYETATQAIPVPTGDLSDEDDAPPPIPTCAPPVLPDDNDSEDGFAI